MVKYQIGIKEAVFKSIKESKKLKFEYITKKDITRNVIQQGIHLKNPEAQIGQALYHLQLKTKYRRPLIKKHIHTDTQGRKHRGWTIIDDKFLWKDD
jgi:uncharacterized protein (DUF1919 family)